VSKPLRIAELFAVMYQVLAARGTASTNPAASPRREAA
jgi:hypothetical protein